MMKRRLLLVATLLLVFVLSCGNKSKKKDDLVTDAGPFPRYLTSIPAETPYAFAAIEPIPSQVIETLRKKAEPIYTQYRQMFAGFPRGGDREMDIAMAFVEEVGDKIMKEGGLSEIGIAKSPTFVLYGLGHLPVLRVQLEDKEKFNEMLVRVEQRAGFTRTEETLEDVPFWSYAAGDSLVVGTFLNDDFVMGVTPVEASQVYVPYMIGVKKPAKSFADANMLDSLHAEYGFKKHGLGYVSLEKIGSMILSGGGEGVNAEIFKSIPATEGIKPPAECQSELQQLANNHPRVVFGYDRLDADGMKARVGLEMKTGLGSDLAATKTSLPLINAPSVQSSMVKGGFGFDVQALTGVLRTRLDAVRQEPFQCPELDFVNTWAMQIVPATGLVPPAVLGIKGGVFSISNVEIVQTPSNPNDPNSYPRREPYVDGFASVRADDPAALFDLLQGFVSEFGNVKLKPDNTPVPVQLPSDVEGIRNASLLLNSALLTLSSGDAAASDASTAMQSHSDNPKTPFAVVDYDLGRVVKALTKSNPDPTLTNMFGSGFLAGRTVVEVIPEARGIFLAVDLPN